MSLVTIKSDKITAVISSKGAELQSVVDQNGKEYIWQRDPAFWAMCAPILFPVAGGFREDRYEWEGKNYPMPKHGYVRLIEWQVEDVKENQATFLMQEKHEGFPWEYDMRVIFTAEGNAISVAYQMTSRDDRPFCFSYGAHEAYATPEGLEAYEIVFDEEETLANYELVGNLTKREPTIMAEKTKTMPLKTEYFAVDALVFRTLKSRAVTLKGGDRQVRVEFPDHPVCMFWTKPGANYICIEPWCNGPDFLDADFQIDKKPGFMRIEKGETITRTHKIIVG